jgi:hypothetical protein
VAITANDPASSSSTRPMIVRLRLREVMSVGCPGPIGA